MFKSIAKEIVDVDILLFLLMFPVGLAAIIALVLLICKKYSASLTLAIPTLIVALVCLISGISFINSTYGWFINLERTVMKDHPFISGMSEWQKGPSFDIYCYSKTAPKSDMEAAYEEIRNYLMSDDGKKQILDSTEGINISFAPNDTSYSYVSYAASKSADYKDWRVLK